MPKKSKSDPCSMPFDEDQYRAESMVMDAVKTTPKFRQAVTKMKREIKGQKEMAKKIVTGKRK